MTALPLNREKSLAATAFLAGLALASMLLISLTHGGVTQQDFEWLDRAPDYGRALVEHGSVLRLILSFDNAFIAFYTAAFIFLAAAVRRDDNRTLVSVALAMLLGTGLLDLVENHHILTMLVAAGKGIEPSQGEISLQMTLSQLKFHLSYLAFFLFAFALPGDTAFEKFLRVALWGVQLPVGILVYTVPEPHNHVFELLRYGMMCSGLFGFAWIFWKRSAPVQR